MKFKTGDRVRIIKNIGNNDFYNKFIGKVYKVTGVKNIGRNDCVILPTANNGEWREFGVEKGTPWDCEEVEKVAINLKQWLRNEI